MMRAKRAGSAHRWRRAVVVLVTSIAVLGSGLVTVADAAPHAPQAPGRRAVSAQATGVADYFSRPGPWGAVRTGRADVPGVRFWYPERLTTSSTTFPILTWGNGSGASADVYTQLIEHLAAWGFVVVASDSSRTGTGQEMLAAAQWMVARNRDPGSVFYQKLRTNRVGAVGHSQGAEGAIRATVLSGGVITSTLPIALPELFYWQPRPTRAQVTALAAQLRHPTFFMYGADDPVADDPEDQALWFGAAGGPALTAARSGVDHAIAVNDNYCLWIIVWFCGQATPILGYATAWFAYTLTGDNFARGAFVGPDGGDGQIMTDANWTMKDSWGLP
jgi:hypothetical protein